MPPATKKPKLSLLEDLKLNYASQNSEKSLYIDKFKTPCGEMIGASDEKFVYFLLFTDSKMLHKKLKALSSELKCDIVIKRNKVLTQLETQLNEYFEGSLKKFSIPIRTIGTNLQKEVWDSLCSISYGKTVTYGDHTKSLGRPVTHSRAIGGACGANAHLLLVPCHRLVGHSATSGGFSAGKDRKNWLIDHERKHSKT